MNKENEKSHHLSRRSLTIQPLGKACNRTRTNNEATKLVSLLSFITVTQVATIQDEGDSTVDNGVEWCSCHGDGGCDSWDELM